MPSLTPWGKTSRNSDVSHMVTAWGVKLTEIKKSCQKNIKRTFFVDSHCSIGFPDQYRSEAYCIMLNDYPIWSVNQPWVFRLIPCPYYVIHCNRYMIRQSKAIKTRSCHFDTSWLHVNKSYQRPREWSCDHWSRELMAGSCHAHWSRSPATSETGLQSFPTRVRHKPATACG